MRFYVLQWQTAPEKMPKMTIILCFAVQYTCSVSEASEYGSVTGNSSLPQIKVG